MEADTTGSPEDRPEALSLSGTDEHRRVIMALLDAPAALSAREIAHAEDLNEEHVWGLLTELANRGFTEEPARDIDPRSSGGIRLTAAGRQAATQWLDGCFATPATIRRARGLTQRALGEQVGSAQAVVSRRERRMVLGAYRRLTRYARALDGHLEVGVVFADYTFTLYAALERSVNPVSRDTHPPSEPVDASERRTLAEIRSIRGVSRAELARRMHTTSRNFDKTTGPRALHTLAHYFTALDGRVEVRVIFTDRTFAVEEPTEHTDDEPARARRPTVPPTPDTTTRDVHMDVRQELIHSRRSTERKWSP